MKTTTASALRIWSDRRQRSGADRAYLIYLVVIGVAAIGFPLVHLIWTCVNSVSAMAVLTSPTTAGRMGSLTSLGLLSVVLAVGSRRGPAVLPPYLTYVLANSWMRRWTVYRRPVFAGLLCLGFLCAGTTAMAGVALYVAGFTDEIAIAYLALAGAALGILVFSTWLAAQVFPRLAEWAAVLLPLVGLMADLLPATRWVFPWGWFGHVLSLPHSSWALALLCSIALIALVAVPRMLERLDTSALLTQSARWEQAVSAGSMMEFGMAAAQYESKPYWGRAFRAVIPTTHLWWMVLRSDAISSMRMPGRILTGILLAVSAAILASASSSFGALTPLVGAAAGLMLFIGVGSFCNGLTHFARTVTELSPYGVSDLRMLSAHATYPLAVTVLLSLAASITTVFLSTGATVWGVVGTVVLGVLAVALRLLVGIKGPLPARLMTAAPSPLGDPMPLVRLAWAADAPLFASLAGVVIVRLPATGAWAIGLVAVLALLLIRRWRHRNRW